MLLNESDANDMRHRDSHQKRMSSLRHGFCSKNLTVFYNLKEILEDWSPRTPHFMSVRVRK